MFESVSEWRWRRLAIGQADSISETFRLWIGSSTNSRPTNTRRMTKQNKKKGRDDRGGRQSARVANTQMNWRSRQRTQTDSIAIRRRQLRACTASVRVAELELAVAIARISSELFQIELH